MPSFGSSSSGLTESPPPQVQQRSRLGAQCPPPPEGESSSRSGDFSASRREFSYGPGRRSRRAGISHEVGASQRGDAHPPGSELEALDAVVQGIGARRRPRASRAGADDVAEPAAAVLDAALVGGTVGVCGARLVVGAGVERPAVAGAPIGLYPAVTRPSRGLPVAADGEVARRVQVAPAGVVHAPAVRGERRRPDACKDRGRPGGGCAGSDPPQHFPPRDPARRSLFQGFLWTHSITPLPQPSNPGWDHERGASDMPDASSRRSNFPPP